ncbi:MAG: nucleotidyltransferase domain-containing protein [Methanoregula sp.]|nr:nucleotidyltransferase domain-containing protein [Methanoregula sp.]
MSDTPGTVVLGIKAMRNHREKSGASIYRESGKDHIRKYMSIQKRYETVIRQFVRQAQERYTSHIDKIILYGSVARGDANADSDIDLLVLWNGDEHEGWRAMTGLAFDVMVDSGEYLSVKVMNAKTFSGASPFGQNVMKEGITVA